MAKSKANIQYWPEENKKNPWCARLMVNGRRYKKYHPTRQAAERWILALQHKAANTLLDGGATAVRAIEIDAAVREFLDYTEQESDCRPSTFRDRSRILRKFEVWAAARNLKKLDKITPDAARSFLADQYNHPQKVQKMAAQTKNNLRNAVSAFFRWAVERHYLASNPCASIKVFRVPQKPGRIFTEMECRALLEASEAHMRIAIALSLYAGLRRGEVMRLRWRDVRDGAVYIDAHGADGHFSAWRPKSAQSYRRVPINADLASELERWRAQAGECLYIVNYRDRPIRYHIDTAWRTLKRKTQIAGRYHDLRRTFATRAHRHGLDLRTLQRLLGHEKLETTARYLDPLNRLSGDDLPSAP